MCRIADLVTTKGKTTDMDPLIRLDNIVKDYRSMRALDGVNLNVGSGITALLGPNGAGKSTLIKVLLGLVKVSGGEGTVLGHRIVHDGRLIRSKVGYMPEDDCYIPGLTGVEVVRFSACLAGIPAVEALRRSHEILDFCGMQQERYRNIETYSTGMRQKIKFASAIVHDPEFLIFDEPTSGLDPEERESLLNRIKMLSTNAGKSVLLSTHILPDVQLICDHVVILAGGRVRLDETLEELNRPTSASITVHLNMHSPDFDKYLVDAGCELHPSDDTGQVVSLPDETDSVRGTEQVASLVWEAAGKTNAVIRSVVPARNSLEKIFMTTVEEAEHADL